jgi:hypothetical protein
VGSHYQTGLFQGTHAWGDRTVNIKSRDGVKTVLQIFLFGVGIFLLAVINNNLPHAASAPKSTGYPPPGTANPPYPAPTGTSTATPDLATPSAVVATPEWRDLKDGNILSPAEVGAIATFVNQKSHIPTADPRIPTPTKVSFPVASAADLSQVVYHDPFIASSDTGLGACIQSKNSGQPQLIHSLDENPDYYLVPFFKDSHLCATALVDLNAGSGSVTAYGEAFGDQYPQVSADEAVNQVITKTGKQVMDKPILVSMKSLETGGPLDPFWQVTTTDNQVYYVIFITGRFEGSDTPETRITVLNADEIHPIR